MKQAIRGLFDGFKKKHINRLATKTGFRQRKGILTPYDFLVLMTLGQLGMPHPSLEGMLAAGQICSPRAHAQPSAQVFFDIRR